MRLRTLLEEFPGELKLSHRSFILRPEVQPDAKFSDYHLQHRQRAKDLTELPYAMPKVGDKYPSSSLPALTAAKWVQLNRPDKFDTFDLALFSAFFERNENISDAQVLAAIGTQCGIEAQAIAQAITNQETIKQVVADHRAAQEMGINGIPGAMFGADVISGAVSLETYRAAARQFLANQ